MVGQAKSSIENLDKRIIEAENPSKCLSDVPHTTSAIAARSIAAAVQAQTLRASAAQAINQSITKVPVTARAQIVTPIQLAAETLVLVGGFTDQKKSSPSEPCFSVARSGCVPSIGAPTTTAFIGSQPTVQLTNGAHGINDQSENTFMEEAYSVFLQSSAR